MEYTWTNPHVYVTCDVKDQSGKVVQWIGKLASRNKLLADGVTKDSLKPGGASIITVRPAKSGTAKRIIRKIMKPDGTAVLSYSRAGGRPPEERARASER